MFCVVYRFRIKPEKERQFQQGWAIVTMALREQSGGLGSRLHRDQDGSWIAYAQWPSEQTWENARGEPTEATRGRELMRDSYQDGFERPEILHKLTVVEDLLK